MGTRAGNGSAGVGPLLLRRSPFRVVGPNRFMSCAPFVLRHVPQPIPCVSRGLWVEVLGNNQNCLANSTACLFPVSLSVRAFVAILVPFVLSMCWLHQADCPEASRISRVISSGWEISERWLDFSSIVVAPIRFAMKRSRSGLIVRSSVETA
jgi:hypothetical protein